MTTAASLRTYNRRARGAALTSEARAMKFHSKPIAEHAEVPLGDEGRLEELDPAVLRARADAMDRREIIGKYAWAKTPADLVGIYRPLVETGADVVTLQVTSVDQPATIRRLGAAQGKAVPIAESARWRHHASGPTEPRSCAAGSAHRDADSRPPRSGSIRAHRSRRGAHEGRGLARQSQGLCLTRLERAA